MDCKHERWRIVHNLDGSTDGYCLGESSPCGEGIHYSVEECEALIRTAPPLQPGVIERIKAQYARNNPGASFQAQP